MKKVILSGMRPTGKLHLGNYFGALENFVKLQEDYKCYFFVADWHALTTGYEDTSEIRENVKEMVMEWISAGIDPDKCTIFLQSQILEHAELHLLLSMITPLTWLERTPTYKEQLVQLSEKNITNYGFLGYPCLMASDILMYNADFVPVGEDQLPHLELTREIARRFNYLYGDTFKEPQPKLTKSKLLPGTDGRKMSKSYGNTIGLTDSPEELRQKVMQMVTDPTRIRKDDPGHPDVCTVFQYHKMFNEEDINEIEADCKKGSIGCVQCKRKLAEKMVGKLEHIYRRRLEIEKDKDKIIKIIDSGCERARKAAGETMVRVRNAMKIEWK
ncbi:MAG: tryptophan--tRNA ligase [Eubacteriales bacterium]|nr:tryptophan--tRNA ligase [Eubacteriales bacterium]